MTKARDNPFSTDRVLTIRYRPQGWTWTELLARLESMHYRGAIVGPRGSGKTTLLEDLSARLQCRDFRCRLIRLSSDEHRIDRRALESIGRDEIILLDGVEQLGRFAWARLQFRARRAAGLIVTTHAPGRLPTLLQTHTTPQLLGEIVADLLHSHSSAEPQTESLFHRHRGNLRGALRELYDDSAVGSTK